jgi:hypothetical protein
MLCGVVTHRQPHRRKTDPGIRGLGRDERPHGMLTVTTGEITGNGSGLEIACPCGVTFERWVTPEDAAEDLAMLARLN